MRHQQAAKKQAQQAARDAEAREAAVGQAARDREEAEAAQSQLAVMRARLGNTQEDAQARSCPRL